MNVLITGSNGQLGSEIQLISTKYSQHSFYFLDLPELDITSKQRITAVIREKNINAIINCAAYTAVDRAEEEVELAYLVNARAVENLVSAAEQFSLKLIQISTDYVFDGTSCTPYVEADSVSPIGVYGKSKFEGEQAVLNSASDSIVIRTSWLYSIYGNNFVKTMLRLGEERDQLGVIADQVGSPTNAADLALACLQIIDQNEIISRKGKIYHFSNEGVASWYDFTKAIHEIAKIDCVVDAIGTKDYPTKAKRPHFSVMDKSKIQADFGIAVPYWRTSLRKCIDQLNKNI